MMWWAVFCIAEAVLCQVCVFGWTKKTAGLLGTGGFWGLGFLTFCNASHIRRMIALYGRNERNVN